MHVYKPHSVSSISFRTSGITSLTNQRRNREKMNTRKQDAAARTYEDFDPTSEWVPEEGFDTLLISLPGFVKENIKVQLDTIGNLKISGERLLDRNKWSRFRKDARVPDNCNFDEIRAKLDGGILHITMPKTITRVDTWDQAKTAKETPKREEDGKDQGDHTGQKTGPSLIDQKKMSGKSNGDHPKDNLAATTDKKTGREAKESEDVDHVRQKMPSTEKAALAGIAEKKMSGKSNGDRPKDNLAATTDKKTGGEAKESKDVGHVRQKMSPTEKEALAGIAEEKQMSGKSNDDGPKDNLAALADKQVEGKAKESKDHVTQKMPFNENTPSDGPAMPKKATDGMMKKKQEENEPVDSGKTAGGLVSGVGSDKSKQLVVNVVVATMVVVALGIYVTCKFRSQDKV